MDRPRDALSLPGLTASPGEPSEELARQLERTVDRLRGMGIARLAASFAPEPTRADAARDTVQRLADAAATLERGPRRAVPRLADAAVGDQLAVVGHDLLAAAAARPGTEADTALQEAASLLLELRRRV